MKKAVGFQALLFDNDGVLIDASAATDYCWRAFASIFSLPPGEVLARVPGRRAADVISYFSDQLTVSADEALAIYSQISTTETRGVRALPGARELLAMLPLRTWTVVTSGTREMTLNRLATAGLTLPKRLTAAEDVRSGKPDPAPYRKAAESLGLSPDLCLGVDDAPPGIASAGAAGCRTLALLTTHTADALTDADLTAPDLSYVRVSFSSNGIDLNLTC